LAGCTSTTVVTGSRPAATGAAVDSAAIGLALTPAPASLTADGGDPLVLRGDIRIDASGDAAPVGALLAEDLRSLTSAAISEAGGAGAQIVLRIADVPALDGDGTGE